MTSSHQSPPSYPDLYFEVQRGLLPLLGGEEFSISLDHYDPKAFGNCVITLRSEDFLVRVIRDKGQVFTEIGLSSAPETLWDLGVLVAFLEGSRDVPGLLALDEELALFQRHRDRILNKTLLRDSATELYKFRNEWSDRRWERLLGHQP